MVSKTLRNVSTFVVIDNNRLKCAVTKSKLTSELRPDDPSLLLLYII